MMLGFKLFRKNYVVGQEEEVKGYYGGDNGQNEYFKRLNTMLRGVELPPMQTLDRESIRRCYESSAPVMGIVNYIAENVGEVARYYELTDKRTGQFVEKHWLYDLLAKPNDRFTLRKFLTAWAINKLLFGDVFVYAPKAIGKDYGKITEMYIIPGQKVAIDRNGQSLPFAGIKVLGSSTYSTIDAANNIFQSFDYNLDDESFFGTSKVVAAAVYLSVMDKGMRRQDVAMDNGGVANVVTPKGDNFGITPAGADEVEDKFNKKKNINRTLALRTAIEVHALGNKPVDLDILTTHKEAVTALCFVYKLPVDLYYGQAKYENAKEAKKTIYEQNAIPLANEFAEDLLNYCGLSQQFTLEVNKDKVDVLKDKSSDVLANLNSAYATLNERREAIGYPRIEEDYADQPIIPAGYTFGEPYDITEI